MNSGRKQMICKYRTILLCFVLAGTYLQGQNINKDSLENRIRADKEDTCKVNDLNVLSNLYLIHGQYDTTINLANRALILARSLNYKTGISPALTNLGIAYHNYG